MGPRSVYETEGRRRIAIASVLFAKQQRVSGIYLLGAFAALISLMRSDTQSNSRWGFTTAIRVGSPFAEIPRRGDVVGTRRAASRRHSQIWPMANRVRFTIYPHRRPVVKGVVSETVQPTKTAESAEGCCVTPPVLSNGGNGRALSSAPARTDATNGEEEGGEESGEFETPRRDRDEQERYERGGWRRWKSRIG